MLAPIKKKKGREGGWHIYYLRRSMHTSSS